MSIFDLAAMLLTISAAFAFLNPKLLRLPTAIGVLDRLGACDGPDADTPRTH